MGKLLWKKLMTGRKRGDSQRKGGNHVGGISTRRLGGGGKEN